MMLADLRLPGRPITTRVVSYFLAALAFGLVVLTLTHHDSRSGESESSGFGYGNDRDSIRHGIARTQKIGKTSSCPDPGNIAVIVKTGATAIHDRLPTQLSTSLRCAKEPLIFSDLESNLGDLPVHDVLSDFTPHVAETNADFNIYRLQQQYLAQGRGNDIPKLRGLSISSKDWRTEGKNAAWSLDKYKFLHMVEHAWQLRPEQDWYLFLEADTYLSWPTFLKWIENLDPTQKLYLGSPVLMYEHDPRIYFAHGGAGILLSGATMKTFNEKKGLANRWDARIEKMWFGDFVLADALHEELHLSISNASLSLSPDDPTSITFRPELLCQPLVTIHHMTSRELDLLWQYEQRSPNAVLFYQDLFKAMFPQGMPTSEKHNWDNGAEDDAYALRIPTDNRTAEDPSSTSPPAPVINLNDPHTFFKACEKSCSQSPECLSFVCTSSSSEKRCHLSTAFKYGRERAMEKNIKGDNADKSWRSGWMHDRIAEMIEQETCGTRSDISWPL